MTGPIHIAIVGSGPSGFYAAEALLRADPRLRVDMFERLPTPFGLVRSGVAPDHPKLKEVCRVFEQIAGLEGFRYFGNLAVGEALSVDELRAAYHAVVLACGASIDRKMGIPGEALPNVHAATEFVGWYNGHPDFRDLTFDLSQETVAIVGHGNVAADVARILAKPVDELRHTDIAAHALEVLAASRVSEIEIIGRRGPAQAKFTPRELRELGEIDGCVAVSEAFELDPPCRAELADRGNVNAVKNVESFQRFAVHAELSGKRVLRFRFCLSPRRLFGTAHVEGMTMVRNRLVGPAFAQTAQPTEVTETLACGLVFKSIGYRGQRVVGLPYAAESGTMPHDEGRVVEGGCAMAGVYVTGWLKRGATGIIGTNRADSIETVRSLLADLPALSAGAKSGAEALLPAVHARGVAPVSLDGWHRLDAAEMERGRAAGKPREKFTRVAEMLAVVGEGLA